MGILTTNYGTLSTENIKVQKDTTIVTELNQLFEDIANMVRASTNISRGNSFKNTRIKVAFAKMDELLTKRFGIKFKTVESDGTPLGIQTAPPIDKNILAGDVDTKYKQLKDYLELIGQNKPPINVDDIDTGSKDWVQLIKAQIQSLEAVDRKMHHDGLVVDLENAKIYGYPSDAINIIHIDIYTLVIKYKLTPEELTAGILHEVGHAFTFIEYSYQTSRHAITLLENIVSEVENNKDPLTAIKIAYMSTFEKDDIAGTNNMVTAIVGIRNKLTEGMPTIGDNSYAFKESERQADIFAIRFGVGQHLATGLHKVYGTKPPKILPSAKYIRKMFLDNIFLAILLAILPGFSIWFLFFVAVYAVLWGIVIYIVLSFLITVFLAILNKGVDISNPYDVDARRLLRIKNELIRELRTEKLDKEDIKHIIKQIDLIIEVAKNKEEVEEHPVYRVVGMMFDYGRSQDEIREMDNLLNDLMNNDLHVMSNRIQTLA